MLVSQCVAQNFLVMELKLLDLIVVVVKSAVNSVSDFIFHSNSQISGEYSVQFFLKY